VKAVFFDLDETLINHDRCSIAALEKVREKYRIPVSLDQLADAFRLTNRRLWDLLVEKEIDEKELRTRRFGDLLKIFSIQVENPFEMGEYYIDIYKNRWFLMDGAIETLEALYDQYPLGIISNGFVDVQNYKIDNIGLRRFFKVIVISGTLNTLKPDPEVFRYACEKARLRSDEIIFVGDSYSHDIVGASRAGLHTVWYNPTHQSLKERIDDITPDCEIHHLKELLEILL